MPAIFHREAFEAVCRDQPAILARLRPDQFDDFDGLEKALSWLTPQRRCDAIYAAWLKSLNSPDSGVLIQVRNRLLREGGLSANYLAEFAQNADDAHPRGLSGEVHIWRRRGWLFVANNGRRFTGNDLHGLCRFFANGAKIAESDKSIGKFGIGFKSCYRIGTEVFVRTWDERERFGFRIPLCRAAIEDSHYDRSAFDRLVAVLQLTNPRTSQDELGYCTPEYLDAWPESIAAELAWAQGEFPKQGSVFAVHLHPLGEEALDQRLHDQRTQVFELCPLFLRHLRVTRLEDTTLRLVQHETSKELSIPGVVEAQQVTLEAQTGKASRSNARFWRLTEAGSAKPWQIALHAEGSFKLSFRPETGETTSLRDGAAYAFFPLSIPWPFRMHLHLDLVTNLDRSNWSSEQPGEIQRRITAAVEALGQWLEARRDNWHSEWTMASLVERVPIRPMAGQTTELPAWWTYEALLVQVQKRALLRTLAGRFSTAQNVRKVELRAGAVFTTGWRRLAELSPDVWGACVVVSCDEAEPWKIPTIKDKELAALARETLAGVLNWPRRSELSRCLLAAIIGVRTESRALIDETIKILTVDETGRTVAELFQEVGGATLEPAWHGEFSDLLRGLSNDPLGSYTFGSRSLSGQCERFSRPGFNPTWKSVPAVMHAQLDPPRWEEFWGSARTPCPADLAERVIDVLRVRNADQNLQPLQEVWLLSPTVPQAFALTHQAAAYAPRRDEYHTRLTQWGLWDLYVARLDTRLETELDKRLPQSVERALAEARFSVWLRTNVQSLAPLGVVGRQWKALFEKALLRALEGVLRPRLSEFAGQIVLSRTIAPNLREAAKLVRSYVEAPPWLDDGVAHLLRECGAGHILEPFRYFSESEFRAHMPELAGGLLRVFWTWKELPLGAELVTAMSRVFSSANKTDRRQFMIGLGQRTGQPLGDFIAFTSDDSDPNTYWLAQARSADDIGLPPTLEQFAELREVCAGPSDLKFSYGSPPTGGLTYRASDVAPDILALPPVQRFRERKTPFTILHHAPLNLEWSQDNRRVAHFPGASFVVDGDRLFVSRLKVDPGEAQIRNVLANYLIHAAQDPEVANALSEAEAQRTPLEAVYNRFRRRIVDVLRVAYTEREGYKVAHIWRELLQNSENAYASLPDPRPEVRPFSVEIDETSSERCRITVTNRGRSFNETDREGNTRDDVERIISVGGERRQTALEIGRFHLGFKSVFSVTDTVEIRSGGYSFSVKDLLLRYPAIPERAAGQQNGVTTFRWHCGKQEASEIAGVRGNAPVSADSRFMHPPYVVFTRFVTEIQLTHRGRPRTMRVHRDDGSEFVNVAIATPDERTVRYRVYRDSLSFGANVGSKAFAVAIMLDERGLPAKIAPEDQVYHVVFPTEQKAWTPCLIDGDFELEGHSRSALRNSRRNLSLIIAAIRKLFEVARVELDKDTRSERWLAWADVLAPEDFWQGVNGFFEEGLSAAQELRDLVKRGLLARIPHRGQRVDVSDLTVPSRLLRRFCERHRREFEFHTESWIDAGIEDAVRRLGVEGNLKLSEWVSDLNQDEPLLERVQGALHEFQASGAVEAEELRQARNAIDRRLAPRQPETPSWLTTQWLVGWWKDNLDEEPYTLTGHLFDWVCPRQARSGVASRTAFLRDRLSHPETTEGKDCWYRMLAHACLISAGRRHSEVIKFLSELQELRILEDTSGGDFGPTAERAFTEIVQRPHDGINAEGEQADFWRRVFYDIRKVHTLVFRNQIAEVFLELCQREDRAESLVPFLRSGDLPGQKRWRGVLGQSAMVPLFFVVRELRRLNVIEHDAADPCAFFVCRPVRRVARKLGWITVQQENKLDVESLIETSRVLHQRMTETREIKAALLPYFDIPLLALDQSGQLDVIP